MGRNFPGRRRFTYKSVDRKGGADVSFRLVMRVTLVFVIFAAAGCFNPIVADGGFACDPEAAQPCPAGYYCRNRAN